jgi:hypothetical protein
MVRQFVGSMETQSSGAIGISLTRRFSWLGTPRLTRIFSSLRGCVTPHILGQLALGDLNRVKGFSTLKYTFLPALKLFFLLMYQFPRPEDQVKVWNAVSVRHVDPSDIPETAKPPNLDNATEPNRRQKKRKAAFDEPV